MISQGLLIAVLFAYTPCVLAEFFSPLRFWKKPIFVWFGFLIHVLAIIVAIYVDKMAVWQSPIFGFGVLSSLVLLIFQILRKQPKMDSLGKVMLPTAFLLLLLGILSPTNQNSVLWHWWVPIHVSLILLGFICFALSFALSITFLIVHSRLKKKQLLGLKDLPSLTTLDRYNHRSMLFGFITLTAGVATGIFWFSMFENPTWFFEPTIISTLVLWLWYAIGIYTRLTLGRRMRWAAWFAVIGFLGFVVLLVVSTFIAGGWHLGEVA